MLHKEKLKASILLIFYLHLTCVKILIAHFKIIYPCAQNGLEFRA